MFFKHRAQNRITYFWQIRYVRGYLTMRPLERFSDVGREWEELLYICLRSIGVVLILIITILLLLWAGYNLKSGTYDSIFRVKNKPARNQRESWWQVEPIAFTLFSCLFVCLFVIVTVFVVLLFGRPVDLFTSCSAETNWIPYNATVAVSNLHVHAVLTKEVLVVDSWRYNNWELQVEKTGQVV
jgi:hypothetical protein